MGDNIEVKRAYYENGQLRYESSYENGKPHGLFKGWYENGKLQYEHHFEKGERHGLWKGWYEDGRLNYIYYYIEGTKYETLEEYERELERRGELTLTKSVRCI